MQKMSRRRPAVRIETPFFLSMYILRLVVDCLFKLEHLNARLNYIFVLRGSTSSKGVLFWAFFWS